MSLSDDSWLYGSKQGNEQTRTSNATGNRRTRMSNDAMQTVKITDQSMRHLDDYLEKFWFDSTGFWYSTTFAPQDFPKRQVDLFIAEVTRLYNTCNMDNSIVIQVFNSNNEIVQTRTLQMSDE